MTQTHARTSQFGLRIPYGPMLGVGEKIKRARLFHRPPLSQRGLSQLTDFTRNQIANFETGRTPVDDADLRQIAHALSAPYAWFLDGADTPPPPTSNVQEIELGTRAQPNLVRYLGTVPAGDWEAPTGDDWDYIEVSESVNPKGILAVRVAGNSMHPVLRHGQVVCIKESKHPRDGVISLARSKDGELTLKILRHTPGGWELQSVNPEYGSVAAEQWEIMGYAIHMEENDPAGLRP